MKKLFILISLVVFTGISAYCYNPEDTRQTLENNNKTYKKIQDDFIKTTGGQKIGNYTIIPGYIPIIEYQDWCRGMVFQDDTIHVMSGWKAEECTKLLKDGKQYIPAVKEQDNSPKTEYKDKRSSRVIWDNKTGLYE